MSAEAASPATPIKNLGWTVTLAGLGINAGMLQVCLKTLHLPELVALGSATLATLTVLPSIYAIFEGKSAAISPSLDPDDPASRYYESA